MTQKSTVEVLEKRIAELEKAELEQKRTEEALRQNEEKYRSLFELESDALFLIDNESGRILDANNAASKIYGYNREELLRLHNTDLSAEPGSTKQATQKELSIVPVRYHKKKDGAIFPVEITANHFDWNGRKVHIAAIREIGWRLKAEESLRQSEMRYQDIVASIPGAVYQFLINPDGSYAFPFMSAGAQNILERPESDLTDPELILAAIHPEDRSSFHRSIDEAAQRMQRWTHEFRIIKPDGRIAWLRGSSNPRRLSNGGILWNGVLLDITERKTAEEALRKSKEFIETVLDNLPIGVAVNSVDPVVKFEYMNENFPKFYRTTRKALSDPNSFWDAVYEDPVFRLEIKKKVLDDCASGDSTRMRWVDVPIVRQGTDTRYISACNIPVHDKQLMISVVWDVTSRKHGEDRIRHLNRVLRAIRELKQLIDREQELEALIHEGCRLLVDSRGYSYALIVLTDENDQPVAWAQAGMGAAFDPIKDALARGELPAVCAQPQSGPKVLVVEDNDFMRGQCLPHIDCAKSVSLCVRLVHGDICYGCLIAEVEHSIGVDDEEQALFGEMADDLAYALSVLQMAKDRNASEQTRLSLEAQLIQAQKLESVGRLAGGVAHDYSNMLSVIIGNTELAMDKVDPSEPLYADLKEILGAARRSTEVTRQLLAFARKQTAAPRVLDLNDTVESMLKMLRRLIGEDIDLVWLPGAGLWPVNMDPAQIDQILANLCVNARDAISGVGRVTIETDKANFDEAYCADHTGFVSGKFILLAVSDDGHGMDRETLSKIFEPFYTTKPVGKGTGLGLATVYGIVKQNNGFINVYSEPAKGTTVRIYLPAHTRPIDEIHGQSDAQATPGRGETVLIVEDEPSILVMAKRMLERLDYKVIAAATPQEAIRLAREYTGQIHLLLTDVVMPEMSGRDLACQIQTLCTDIKTLFMSGYTADVIARQGVLDAGVNFIQKPLSIKELALKVRGVLDNA